MEKKLTKDEALAKCLKAIVDMTPQLATIIRRDVLKDFLEGANAFAIACQSERKARNGGRR